MAVRLVGVLMAVAEAVRLECCAGHGGGCAGHGGGVRREYGGRVALVMLVGVPLAMSAAARLAMSAAAGWFNGCARVMVDRVSVVIVVRGCRAAPVVGAPVWARKFTLLGPSVACTGKLLAWTHTSRRNVLLLTIRRALASAKSGSCPPPIGRAPHCCDKA